VEERPAGGIFLASKRTVLIVNLVLSLFFLMNATAITTGLTLYPSLWRYVLLAAVLGNLLWLLVPLIFKRHSSSFFRVSRAILAPFWVLWNFFIFLYTILILSLGALWLVTFKWGGTPFPLFVRYPSDVFFGIITFICLVGLIQCLFFVKLERVPVRIPNLPVEFVGFKIAMVSDLHVGHFTRLSRLRQFSRVAREAQPDLFFVCGDITDDDPHYLRKFLLGLDPLDPSLPLVGVLGNHDVYADPEKTLRMLKHSHVRMLVNEGFEIKRGKASLWIAGVGDQGARRFGKWGSVAPDFDKALAGKPQNAVTILMAHQPQGFLESAKRDVELTLSGHTHGGQFGFKSLKWSLAKLFLRFHMGLFQQGKSQLYVTPGTGYWGLPVRFGLSPEVTLIELRPSA
jgi:hypothetical protein